MYIYLFNYPLLQTYIVIIFTEKAKLRHCQDVEKIIQEFDIQTTLEVVRLVPPSTFFFPHLSPRRCGLPFG